MANTNGSKPFPPTTLSTPRPIASRTARRVVGTLTNSPGCAPGTRSTPSGEGVDTLSRADLLDLFSASEPARPSPADPAPARPSPAVPARPTVAKVPLRRHSADGRPQVRVDAWATPASVSWTRTRKTIRKVSRRPQSTDWALPY